MTKRKELNKLAQECECGEVLTGSSPAQMKHNMKMHVAGEFHTQRMKHSKMLENNELKDGKKN